MIVPIKLLNTQNISYDISIDSLPKLYFDTKVVVVTNPTVANLHLTKLIEHLSAPQLEIVTIPDGEEYKTLETVEKILDKLFEYKLDRKSQLIAFGGGVIGDMTGFTASLYQRGIDFIQIPTTLLSQVDASVGGKTGVNNKFGKNLIGAFYQPKAVYIDPEFLTTLPPREYSAGIAEIIKMAVMFDSNYFDLLEKTDLFNQNALKEIIKRSVEIKANVVNQDERESGIRAVLNYGHTFGHVIENETNYTRYLHGEAVAIGMVMANRLAVRLDMLSLDEESRVINLLKKYNLPTTYEIADIDSFYEHFFLDKKSENNKLKFILPLSIGNYEIKQITDEKTIKAMLNEFEVVR